MLEIVSLIIHYGQSRIRIRKFKNKIYFEIEVRNKNVLNVLAKIITESYSYNLNILKKIFLVNFKLTKNRDAYV